MPQPTQAPAPASSSFDDMFNQAATADKNGLNPDALAKYPPVVQSIAKQLAEYSTPVTPYMFTRAPLYQAAAQAAHEYDPTFNVGQYDVRQAMRKDFTSGPTSKAMSSVNMAIKHLSDLKDAAVDLNNFSGAATPLNAPVNWIEKIAGNKRVGVFDTRANAVAGEMVKATRGTGGAEADVQSWRNLLDHNASPEQQNGNIDAAVDLLAGRIAASRDTYEKGMGRPPVDLQFLSPRSRQILTGMGYDPDKVEQGASAKDAKIADWKQQAATAAAGTVIQLPNGNKVKKQADGTFLPVTQ